MMTSELRRRLALPVLGLLGLLGLAAAGGRWWYVTSRPEYRLRAGQEALGRGDWDAAEEKP